MIKFKIKSEPSLKIQADKQIISPILCSNEKFYLFKYCFLRLFFQNDLRDLESPYITDLDLWDCFARVKLVLLQKFHRTDLVI